LEKDEKNDREVLVCTEMEAKCFGLCQGRYLDYIEVSWNNIGLKEMEDSYCHTA